MAKHWFTLYPDTFLWLKGNKGFAYQAKNKKKFEFSITNKIENICCRLLIPENLYTVELANEELNNEEINSWTNSLISMQAGYISLNVEFAERPVSLKPILKVQDKKERYEWQHNEGTGGEILDNVHELTFYINGSEHGSDEFYKQNIFPLKNCQTLDKSKIQFFIRNSLNQTLSNINFVGNVFMYPDFEMLIQEIEKYHPLRSVHVMGQDFIDNIHQMNKHEWINRVQMNILIDSAVDLSSIKQVFDFPVSITVFVFSEKDFELLENISDYQNVRLIPLYNKENISFFEANVFMDKYEINTIDVSKNEIFMHQAFNTCNFGRLTVLADGSVYANVNAPVLGNINNSPYSLVYKEFTEGRSWFNIRDKAPCTDCLYQWICPSPSNYEIVIGKPNLCNIYHE